jgi:multiple sugar transport system ATP-binding protein
MAETSDTDLIRFEGVTKRYRSTTALENVTIGIAPGTLTVVAGHPQCGKSVLLRLLIGLERPEAGRILLGGQDVTRVAPGRRRIGYVPQSFALFPHMSVAANIAYPLRFQRIDRATLDRRLNQVAELVQIGHLLEKTPDQLSGGEKQRTAVARGLMSEAEVFVFDDPLVGLDFKLREQLMDDLKDIQREIGATFVYATADSLEALTMAQSLLVMDAGRVVERNAVDRLYHEPAHRHSFDYVGFPRPNLLDGELAADGRCRCPLGDFQLAPDADTQPSGAGHVEIGLRPEDIDPAAAAGSRARVREGRVRLVEDLGAEYIVYFDDGDLTLVTAYSADEAEPPAHGGTFRYAIDPGAFLVFDPATGRRLGRGREAGHG